jgi:hypothetical protein
VPAIPVCSITIVDAVFLPGVSKQIYATCIPEATTYTWSDNLYGCSSALCPIQKSSPDTYTVIGKNKDGLGNMASIYYAPPIPAQPINVPSVPTPTISPTEVTVQTTTPPSPPSPEVVGICSRRNTNHVLNPPNDHGHNFNTYTSHGSSDSFQFTTTGEGQSGSVIREQSSIANPIVGFVNISKTQCDFTYPDFKNWTGCGMSQGAQISIQYIVEATDSKTFGKCSLRPYTTYYVNIRNEDAGFDATATSRGGDTCLEGQQCGFLFQYH